MGKQGSVTLGDIARECGLSRATVSRSLNNNPQIPEKTRLRVQKIARRMGFVPDPETSRLMGYLKRAQENRFQSTLGILNAFPDREAMTGPDHPYNRSLIQGVRKRAQELGYAVDEIWIAEPGLKPKRIDQILKSRAIRGVLVPPEYQALPEIQLDWSVLTTVAMATTGNPEQIHRVLPNNLLNLQRVMREVVRRGYRRPGLATTRDLEDRMFRAPVASYLSMCDAQRAVRKLPVFFWEEVQSGQDNADRMNAWFQKNQPDVVIGAAGWMMEILAKDLGLQCPQDYAFVSYSAPEKGVAGLDQLPEVIGAAAVDLVSAHIARGEVGIPEHPKHVMIEGTFVEGSSFPDADSQTGSTK